MQNVIGSPVDEFSLRLKMQLPCRQAEGTMTGPPVGPVGSKLRAGAAKDEGAAKAAPFAF